MIQDDLYAKSGGNFPYRRYIEGTSNNIAKLEHLVNKYSPEYDNNGFDRSKIESIVASRFTGGESIFDFFEAGPKNVSQTEDWELNAVIDQYTESARMSSPGYGKSHSPVDLWFRTSFSKLRERIFKGKGNLHDARESIYKAGEVRLAYVTDCIGLYNYVKNELLNNPTGQNPKVIDITAFGDRLTAAAATGFEYIGLDPDPGLVDGISRLMLDLKAIKPEFKANTYTIPLEHFTSDSLVDFVSLSPPPYSAEPYTGGDRQTHKVYRDFRHWFYGFVKEALVRAFYWLREGGILGFTVLDRDYPHKITYTEAMIMMAMKIGFRPYKIFTLSSDSGTPWWLFKKDSDFTSPLFDSMYPELTIPDIQKNHTPAIEYIRYLASNYVTEICVNHNIFKEQRPHKVKDLLGRILMSKIPGDTEPDYLFPDESSDVIMSDEDFNNIEDMILPIVIQTSDSGYRNVITSNDSWTGKDVLLNIFNVVVSFIHWTQCTVEYQQFERNLKVGKNSKNNVVNLFIERKDQISAISFLRKRTLFTKNVLDSIRIHPKFISLWMSADKDITTKNVSSYIRYDAVGASAHHLTRTDTRIDAIAKITGVPSKDTIVDLFATPSNSNSKLYASVYPDVDEGSLGNFFLYDGGKYKVLMANPPPYKGFNEAMIDRLMNVYLGEEAPQDRIIFYSTTMWDDKEGANYIKKVKSNEDPNFMDFEEYHVLSTLWKDYKDYIHGVYVLDYATHSTYDMAKGVKRKHHDNTESIGVILSKNPVDLSDLGMLSGGNHVIF